MITTTHQPIAIRHVFCGVMVRDKYLKIKVFLLYSTMRKKQLPIV
jgi:hypothetical protein